MYLIATLLIIYLLWRIFKPYVIRYAQERYIRYVTRQAREAFEQQRRQQASPRPGEAWGGNPFFTFFTNFDQPFGGGSQQQPRHAKKFTGDMGEYVEFEELEGEFHSQHDDGTGYVKESQISDAEWEELR